MYKMSSGRLIESVKLMKKSLEIIDILEKSNKKQMVFNEHKEKLNSHIDMLVETYGLETFEEWKTKK